MSDDFMITPRKFLAFHAIWNLKITMNGLNTFSFLTMAYLWLNEIEIFSAQILSPWNYTLKIFYYKMRIYCLLNDARAS